MPKPPPSQVTQLLAAYCNGRQEAFDQLLPLVYNQLHKMARQQRRSRRDYTLNTTALVHEAYIKLVKHPDPAWENRSHFFRVAAKAMRQILVDYAKAQLAAKRGGDAPRLSLNRTGEFPLEERIQLSDERTEEMLTVDAALKRLAEFDERLSQIVELRYFAGFTIAETAEAMDLSPTTIKREWTTARAWLFRELH
ncbi:MAG TPA: sigma-70 family RNA polymerase sigma factor [Rhodothermales bacterium]|nr:sigma-70 family RNA polymerase sigma factor [Rhodothermales bacterium]